VRGKGLGVRTLSRIRKGQFVAEYQYSTLHSTRRDEVLAEEEYKRNREGSYILEGYWDGRRVYFDATRSFKSVGRYISRLVLQSSRRSNSLSVCILF
jgi:SET domain-containing protein